MRTRILATTLFILLLAPALAAAQTCPDRRPYEIVAAGPDETQEVTVTGGTKHLGRVVEAGDPVRFELLSGDMLELGRERITCLRTVPGTRQDGVFWPEDPNTTRLFFGPTGRSLAAGTGYFSVVELVMPFLSFGLSDRFTMSGGTPLFFGDGGPRIFWLAPKLQVIETQRLDASVGVITFFATGETGSVGVLYGVATLGETPDRAITVGAGWGYSSEDGIHDAPALMVGGETRLTRGVKLITENYLFPSEDFGIVSFGPRFFGEKLTADLGLAVPIFTGESLFAFPLVNFAYNW